MSGPTEAFKEKYREEGRQRAWGTAREQQLIRLETIAASDDIESAVECEIIRLRAEGGGEGAVASASNLRQAQALRDAMLGASQQSLDNGDLVASALGLTMPSAAPAPSARQSLDDQDRVAASLSLGGSQ